MFTRHLIFAVLALVLLVGAGLWLFPAWQDYAKTREAIVDVQAQSLQHQAENEALKTEIHQLRTDPRAIERVARDKFGYCRPQEKVYDFKDTARP